MFRRVVLFVLILCLVSACRVTAMPDDSVVSPSLLGPGIYDVAEGRLIEPDALFARLAQARFVLVGESHDDVWHHEVQRRVYEKLAAGDVPAALGMEMFQRDVQPVLDAYVAGEIDEAAMLEQTMWSIRWGMDPDFYSAIWRIAQAHGYPVVALNIERELVRDVGRKGVDGLTAEQQAQLPEMDLSNDAYRHHLRQIFAQHGMGDDEERLDKFFQAQVLWDEAMAASGFEFMIANPAVERIVMLAGSGHITRGWGIPSRLERRIEMRGEESAGQVVTVLPVTIRDADGDSDNGMHYRDLNYLQRESLADFVWIGPES